VEYLLSNLQLDFSGDVSAERMREFLREDDGREARRILAKLLEENGSEEELLLTLADCLKEHIRTGITADRIREQQNLYPASRSPTKGNETKRVPPACLDGQVSGAVLGRVRRTPSESATRVDSDADSARLTGYDGRRGVNPVGEPRVRNSGQTRRGR